MKHFKLLTVQVAKTFTELVLCNDYIIYLRKSFYGISTMGKLDSLTIDQINLSITVVISVTMSHGTCLQSSPASAISLCLSLGSWPRVSVTGDGLGRTRRRCRQQPGSVSCVVPLCLSPVVHCDSPGQSLRCVTVSPDTASRGRSDSNASKS